VQSLSTLLLAFVPIGGFWHGAGRVFECIVMIAAIFLAYSFIQYSDPILHFNAVVITPLFGCRNDGLCFFTPGGLYLIAMDKGMAC